MTRLTPSVSLSSAADAATPGHFHSFTLIGALVAGVTTFATLAVSLPAWAMFLGWVGYSVGTPTARDGVSNVVSFLLGLALGVGTSLASGLLTPLAGRAATPIAVFGVVAFVLSLRSLPLINNPLAYFLGIISIFAAAQAPSTSPASMLAAAGIVGAVGAWLASFLQSRLQRDER